MVRVYLTPSRYLAAALLGVHLAAGIILLPLETPVFVKIALALAVAVSLAHALWRHAFLKAPGAFVAIELREHNEAAAQTPDGAWHEARVLGTSCVTPVLSVLNLRVKAMRFARHMIIVPDNVDAEDFRRLRVLLRWGYRKDVRRRAMSSSAGTGLPT